MVGVEALRGEGEIGKEEKNGEGSGVAEKEHMF